MQLERFDIKTLFRSEARQALAQNGRPDARDEEAIPKTEPRSFLPTGSAPS